MKILLPVDGSDCSDVTLEWSADTFDRQMTQYYLIFVASIITVLPMVEFNLAEATRMLKRAQTKLEKQGCHVIEAEYVLGMPIEQICKYAVEQNMDLVEMGTHGHSGLSKLLMGSISQGVLEHCKRPVLLFKKNSDYATPQAEHHPMTHTIL